MSDSPIKILLVEDNPGDARLLQLTLAEADSGRFELTHVSTLSEGLERLTEDRIDVVLLDLSLPDSQGLDTFLKAHAQAPGVPFVVLTGLADERMAVSALREGAQDYLVKGQVDSSLLARSMRYAIERRGADEALRQSEERFRRLVEQAADGFFVIQRGGRLLDVNQMACEQFDYPREDLLTRSATDIYTTIDAEALSDTFQRLAPGVPVTLEGVGRRKDGSTFPIEIRCGLIELAGSQHMFALVRDITERKGAEVTLVQQMREMAVLEERNRMAREIHDTLAQGFTGIVLQLEAADQVLDGQAADVAEHLTRAKGLARESLQEARRSVWGLVPHALEETTLEEALRERVKQIDDTGPESASFSLSGQPRTLPVDVQAAIFRICQESLANITRHARAKEVKVNLSFDQGVVGLNVQDDGIGFEIGATKATDGAGGFGLVSMEQRVRLLGGSITVKSLKGRGTSVDVQVPVE